MQALHDALKALPDRRDIAPDIVAKMPLLEKTEDRPATKSDAGHASSQGAALQEEFFEAATLDHGTSLARLTNPVPSICRFETTRAVGP